MTTETRQPTATLPMDARVMALSHLAMRSARELTHLVAETHATISSAPLPLPSRPSASARQAPLPYRLISHTFMALARFSRLFLKPEAVQRVADGLPVAEGPAWRLFQSALNGVCGDSLDRWENPLAQGMSIRNAAGEPLDADTWPGKSRQALLFVHGLCLSEREWQTPAHQAFVERLQARGVNVAYLRYNSGLSIAGNGRSLSVLLDSRLGGRKGLALTLVGHSMGGLLIRAASLHANNAQQENKEAGLWLKSVTEAAYLASPHQGSVWERLGDKANNLLSLTPYTRPFMRLGNIRSEGIRDLRHGNVGTSSNRLLPDQARHLLLAADLAEDSRKHWLGDGLVTVDSALGQHAEADRALTASKLDRRQIAGLGHMAMLADERLYQVLEEWSAT